MLELRPNCECCDKDLPPEAPDAMICTFECTFCADCAGTRARRTLPQLRRQFFAAPDPPGRNARQIPGLDQARPEGRRLRAESRVTRKYRIARPTK